MRFEDTFPDTLVSGQDVLAHVTLCVSETDRRIISEVSGATLRMELGIVSTSSVISAAECKIVLCSKIPLENTSVIKGKNTYWGMSSS